MQMPFGKYKGEELENIPPDYLEWCLENCDMRPALAEEMQNQLALKSGRGVWRSKETR